MARAADSIHSTEQPLACQRGTGRMAVVACVGIAVMDFLFAVESLPAGDGKFYAKSFREIAGGVAANAAYAVARLGGDARYIGRVGDDRIGTVIVDELIAVGVDTSGVHKVPGFTSPVSAVLVDEAGERLIVNHTSPDLFAAGDVLPRPTPRWSRRRTRRRALAIRCGRAAAGRQERSHSVDFRLRSPDGRRRPNYCSRSCTHVAFSATALEATSGIDDPGGRPRRDCHRVPTPGWR